MAIDFRGHGSSTDWKGRELDWRGFSQQGVLTMIRDIDAAIRHTGSSRNLWLIGSSLGANLALHYAADHPEIRGLVLLSPGFNYAGIESEPAMERYGARPVLIAGSKDDPGTLKICERLHELAAGPKIIFRYETAGHGSQMLDYEKKLKEEILQWLNTHSI